MQLDAYAGYDVLFSETANRKRVGCLAHIFRKFKDFWQSIDSKSRRPDDPARKIMGLIDDLYEIEEPLKALSAAERLTKRKESKAEEIFDQLEAFIASECEAVSKSSPYFAALRYARDELPLVRRYLEHGEVMIDNNKTENAIRPFALGRRNWLFICSDHGAQGSANIYSVLTTARANGIEPYRYLEHIITRLPHCQTNDDYEELLPSKY